MTTNEPDIEQVKAEMMADFTRRYGGVDGLAAQYLLMDVFKYLEQNGYKIVRRDEI